MFHVHVDAIVCRGNEILIMKRAMGFMSGAWYLPGGALENDEQPNEAVRREIREETELEVANVRPLCAWQYMPDETAHGVGITYVCDAASDAEPVINEEHSAARWVDPNYYRQRYFNDEALEALKEHPIAYGVVSKVRDVLDTYLAELS